MNCMNKIIFCESEKEFNAFEEWVKDKHSDIEWTREQMEQTFNAGMEFAITEFLYLNENKKFFDKYCADIFEADKRYANETRNG